MFLYWLSFLCIVQHWTQMFSIQLKLSTMEPMKGEKAFLNLPYSVPQPIRLTCIVQGLSKYIQIKRIYTTITYVQTDSLKKPKLTKLKQKNVNNDVFWCGFLTKPVHYIFAFKVMKKSILIVFLVGNKNIIHCVLHWIYLFL